MNSQCMQYYLLQSIGMFGTWDSRGVSDVDILSIIAQLHKVCALLDALGLESG